MCRFSNYEWGGGVTSSIELECGQLTSISEIIEKALVIKPSITNIQNLKLPSGNIWTKPLTVIYDGTTKIFPLFSLYNFTENYEMLKPKKK